MIGNGDWGFGFQSFVWDAANGLSGLSTMNTPSALSADGSVVVGAGGGRALIWDQANGAQDLELLLGTLGVDLSGWQSLDTARGISNDGKVIVGNGINAIGDEQGFLVIIPEPTSALLLAVGLMALGRGARASRSSR